MVSFIQWFKVEGYADMIPIILRLNHVHTSCKEKKCGETVDVQNTECGYHPDQGKLLFFFIFEIPYALSEWSRESSLILLKKIKLKPNNDRSEEQSSLVWLDHWSTTRSWYFLGWFLLGFSTARSFILFSTLLIP